MQDNQVIYPDEENIEILSKSDKKKKNKHKHKDKNIEKSEKTDAESYIIDNDLFKSEIPYGTVLTSLYNNELSFVDMKGHLLNDETSTNQKYLADYYASINQNKSANIIFSYGIFPRRTLSLDEDGSKQLMAVKMPEEIMPGTVVYAQCYSVYDGPYIISGVVNNDGYALFKDYILRDEVNVTVFSI